MKTPNPQHNDAAKSEEVAQKAQTAAAYVALGTAAWALVDNTPSVGVYAMVAAATLVGTAAWATVKGHHRTQQEISYIQKNGRVLEQLEANEQSQHLSQTWKKYGQHTVYVVAAVGAVCCASVALGASVAAVATYGTTAALVLVGMGTTPHSQSIRVARNTLSALAARIQERRNNAANTQELLQRPPTLRT